MLVNVGKGIELTVPVENFAKNADKTAGWSDVTFGETLAHLLDESPALSHVVMIGLRNILMDSHASITTDEYPDATERADAARAMVDKKLAALMSGEVRVASTREGDPVRAEAMRRAMQIVHAVLKQHGKKPKDYDAKALREAAAKKITPELLAEAKAYVEKTRVVDGGDLADLGL